MASVKSLSSREEQDLLEQINRIVLLKMKTLIVRNLQKEDIPEFEKIVRKNNSNLLLDFAHRKIPHLAQNIYKEIEKLGQTSN